MKLPEPKTGKAEGFDMGIKDFLTGSGGTRYESPMFYKRNAKKLVIAQKAFSRKVKGSTNWERERRVSIRKLRIKEQTIIGNWQ